MCDLFFIPQQVEVTTVDGSTQEVQAIICNVEFEITKPEDHPAHTHTYVHSIYKCHKYDQMWMNIIHVEVILYMLHF